MLTGIAAKEIYIIAGVENKPSLTERSTKNINNGTTPHESADR